MIWRKNKQKEFKYRTKDYTLFDSDRPRHNRIYSQTSNPIHSEFFNPRSNNPFFIYPYISEKNKRKSEHHKAVFDILKEWSTREFKIVPDFTLFRLDLMKIDVIEQILSRDNDDKKNPIKFNEMVLDHLNCKEYQDSYQKYNKIKELQDNFNYKIIQFMDYNRNHLKEFLTSYNSNSTEKQLDDYLQFYLVWIYYKQKLSDNEFKSQIKELNGQIIIQMEEPYRSLTNPFPKLTDELIIVIKKQSNEVISKINPFYQMIDEIKKSLEDFQKSIDSIIAYESVGLKGKCEIEEKLSIFKKFWKSS